MSKEASRKIFSWWQILPVLAAVCLAAALIFLPGLDSIRSTGLVVIMWLVVSVLSVTIFVGRVLKIPVLVRCGLIVVLVAIAGVISLKYDKRSRWLFKNYGPFVFEYTGDGTRYWHWRWSVKAPEKYHVNYGSESSPRELEQYSFPQFLGPDRNAALTLRLNPDWEAYPPKLLWKRSIGPGWSGFAIANGIAVTQEQDGGDELVTAYALDTGNLLWKVRRPATLFTEASGNGPRTTPLIDQDRVYALGATGILDCIQLESGIRLWSTNILTDADAENLPYGVSGSPLLYQGNVVVNPGGKQSNSLVAYNKMSGKRAWGQGNSRASYSSPVIATIGDRQQFVIMNGPAIEGYDLSGGGLLWMYPWKVHGSQMITASQPLFLPKSAGDAAQKIFLSSGYGKGCALISVRPNEGRFEVSEVWPPNSNMNCKFTSPVYHNGYAYGLDNGILACVDLSNGNRMWKKGRYGHGQILLANDHILVMTEKGKLCLVQASPEEFRELGRIQAIKGKTWNNPALAGPYLVVRNSTEVACFKLELGESSKAKNGR